MRDWGCARSFGGGVGDKACGDGSWWAVRWPIISDMDGAQELGPGAIDSTWPSQRHYLERPRVQPQEIKIHT